MDKPNVLYSYASFWARQETNLESALKAAKKCIELKPQPYYWNVLSKVHWKMGDLNAARTALEEAMDIQPSNVSFRNQMKKLKAEMEEAGQ